MRSDSSPLGPLTVTRSGSIYFCKSYDSKLSLDSMRSDLKALLGGHTTGATLVVIEEPLLFAARSAKTARGLFLRAGQFVEMAERAQAPWRLVNVSTWKAARGIKPNAKSEIAKAQSIVKAKAAIGPLAHKAIDGDVADAINLGIYAANKLSTGEVP